MSVSDTVLPLVTARQIAHPWLCDVNGHLNTRHYQGFFDDACQHLLAAAGFHGATENDGTGIVDARCVMEYLAEVAPGALVVIHSGFVKLGTKSVTSRHEMRSFDGQRLYATSEHVSLFFDLKRRASMPIPDDFRADAQALTIPVSE